MIENPILPGFNPDPCILRRGEDYYIAVSSFEWLPGVPVYHSRDLKNWRLLTHCLDGNSAPDLRRLPSAKGVWAPCLTWCEEDGLFYLLYSVMNSTNARFFDVDNFLITAPEITGPWSEPVYLHSAGFDPSLFHDGDGRKWISCLEWEFRDGYEQPGVICLVEYDPAKKEIIGLPKRVWWGGSDRGCIEGPHIFKRNGLYYIMCAEGGTGYGHCVTVGRSDNIWGPYESDPENPVLTSCEIDFYGRRDTDFLKPQYYNPSVRLQKAGHGSLVETPLGEVYMVHHCARPFMPEKRCTLGRETAIQKMRWTDDGWLRLEGGGNIARECATPSELPAYLFPESEKSAPSAGGIPPGWYAPRVLPGSFASVAGRGVRLCGQESLSSLNSASLLARKLTSLQTQFTVKMEFKPEIYQHYAGLALYYDNMDYILLRKYWSESLNSSALGIMRVENGQKTEIAEARAALGDSPLWLRLLIDGRESRFLWSRDGESFAQIGGVFDTSEFSDEYCKHGEFTGCFAGIFCVDSMLHRQCAHFVILD